MNRMVPLTRQTLTWAGNPSLDRGNTQINRPSIFVANLLVPLPELKGHNALVQKHSGRLDGGRYHDCHVRSVDYHQQWRTHREHESIGSRGPTGLWAQRTLRHWQRRAAVGSGLQSASIDHGQQLHGGSQRAEYLQSRCLHCGWSGNRNHRATSLLAIAMDRDS